MVDAIFGLILTSCVLDVNHNVTCEDFIIDTATTLQQCQNQMIDYRPELLELDSLLCERLTEGETVRQTPTKRP